MHLSAAFSHMCYHLYVRLYQAAVLYYDQTATDGFVCSSDVNTSHTAPSQLKSIRTTNKLHARFQNCFPAWRGRVRSQCSVFIGCIMFASMFKYSLPDSSFLYDVVTTNAYLYGVAGLITSTLVIGATRLDADHDRVQMMVLKASQNAASLETTELWCSLANPISLNTWALFWLASSGTFRFFVFLIPSIMVDNDFFITLAYLVKGAGIGICIILFCGSFRFLRLATGTNDQGLLDFIMALTKRNILRELLLAMKLIKPTLNTNLNIHL